MYLDCTIKIPDSNGKITKKTIKGTTYIYYEYARIYLKDKNADEVFRKLYRQSITPNS